MKVLTIILFCASSLSLASQEKLEDQLQGKWMMDEVFRQGQDVSSEHNPQNNRYIVFKEDGTFESGGDPWGMNTGTYYVNNHVGTLHLDSDAGPEDDSYWKIVMEKSRMTWRGTGSEFAKEFVITHRRVD